MKPLFKPRTALSRRQKELMMIHKNHHSTKHLTYMTKMMKKGYCFEQAHELAKKNIGK